PRGTLPEVTRGFACRDEFFEGGFGARNESFAGFGKTDTARCADEEGCADSRFQRAYRLADRRWRYPEVRGRFAEIPVLGNTQERDHAVERALPDCEVLLHSPSTLSWIVSLGKRSYVGDEHPRLWQ